MSTNLTPRNVRESAREAAEARAALGEESKMTVKEAVALLNAGESSVRMWCGR